MCLGRRRGLLYTHLQRTQVLIELGLLCIQAHCPQELCSILVIVIKQWPCENCKIGMKCLLSVLVKVQWCHLQGAVPS